MDEAISWSCCSTFFVEGNAETWEKASKMNIICLQVTDSSHNASVKQCSTAWWSCTICKQYN